MRLALATLLILASAAASADRRPHWTHIDGLPGHMRLGDTKVVAVIADSLDAQTGGEVFACFEAPADHDIHACPNTSRGRVHLWISKEDWELIDSVKVALMRDKFVTLFVDPERTRENFRGEKRCRVMRVVLSEAE